jgi:hypothetical protein
LRTLTSTARKAGTETVAGRSRPPRSVKVAGMRMGSEPPPVLEPTVGGGVVAVVGVDGGAVAVDPVVGAAVDVVAGGAAVVPVPGLPSLPQPATPTASKASAENRAKALKSSAPSCRYTRRG